MGTIIIIIITTRNTRYVTTTLLLSSIDTRSYENQQREEQTLDPRVLRIDWLIDDVMQ